MKKWLSFLVIVVLSLLVFTFQESITGALTLDSRDTISIATWNIENFGQKKASDPVVMQKIARAISRHDMVALQELSNVDEAVDPFCSRNADACPGPKCNLLRNALQEALEKEGRNYSILISPQVKDERYAFLYDAEKVELLGVPFLVEDSGESLPFCNARQENTGLMTRQPYLAAFRSGAFDFVLMTAHTSPSKNLDELEGLGVFFEEAIETGEHVVLLGDLNADCKYLSLDEEIVLRKYQWLVPDYADTTVSNTDCAYDQFIINQKTSSWFAQRSGVDTSITKSVSDHYLVWAEFYTS